MLQNSGPIALTVLGILAISSLFSWAVIFAKLSSFGRARTQSQRFLRAFRKATRLQDIAAVSEQFKPSPLVNVFDEVYETYRRQTGGAGPPRNITSLERSAQTAASEALTVLEKRMTWLATIGAVSPFVGLFGTIMGIVDAFHGLGTAGSATLRAVAPGISEALITTAAGLLVAVPAVIAYNQFTAQAARIRRAHGRLRPRAAQQHGRRQRPPPGADRSRPRRKGDGTWRSQLATGTPRPPSRTSTSRRWSTWCSCCWSSS